MICENEKRNKDGQNSLHSKRQRFVVKLREEQLQKIFKSFRNKILKHHYEQYVSPQMQMPNQHLIPNFTPENIQLFQQYLMSLIPPQLSTNQQRITDHKNYQIQHNCHRQKILPKQYEIYFEKQNIRVYKKLLGEGSFSKVWLGMDLVNGERIAAKEVKKLEESQQRCLKQFDSPNIIKVLQIIRHQNSTFIILQFCSKNLRQQLVSCKYDLTKSLNYFQQIVRGMSQLQQNNIIHRDLKFQNILLSHNTIKISDFGLAKFLGDQMEIQSRRCGSPYTMAPQIYFANSQYTSYTSKCDIWSLGIILHEMLYEVHPFGMSRQNFQKGLRTKLKKSFGILDYLIDRCLVQDPKKRADWGQFMQIFQRYFLHKDKYLPKTILPLNIDNLMQEQRPLQETESKLKPLIQRQDQVQIVVEVQRKRKRKNGQIQQKKMNDFNANNHKLQKKGQKRKIENEVKICKNAQKNLQESNFKQLEVNVPQDQNNMQKANEQNKCTPIKLSKSKAEVKNNNVFIQLTALGLVTAVIIVMFLLK